MKFPLNIIVVKLLFTAGFLLIASCSGPGDTATGSQDETAVVASNKNEKEIPEMVPDDPGELLRVIVRPEAVAFLPRNAEPVRLDREIAEGLSEDLGLTYQPVIVEDYPDMIDQLIAGKGDVIAASMTVTKSRNEKVLFSIPYQYVDELLVVPSGENSARKWSDLNGKTICVREGSSYVETLEQLQTDNIGLQITPLPGTINTEEIVEQVASGDCPATVVDSHYWSSISRHYEEVQALRALAEARPIALAVRRGEDGLKESIDQYLIKRALTGRRDIFFSDDLPGLKKRKRIRMITRNSAATYYLYRGSPFGFDYELLKRFADQEAMRLEIVIPDDHESIIQWLNEGRGDIAAAMLTITPEREEHAAFTRPYFYDEEVLVTRSDEPVRSLEELKGRTIYIRRSSSYYNTLQELQEKVDGVHVEFVPEDMQTEDILKTIDDGEWDVTICNRDLLQIEQTWGSGLIASLTLNENNRIAWAVRKSGKKLLNELNKYIDREYRGLFYNLRKQRYFENRKSVVKADSIWRSDRSGAISPYDDIVRDIASDYGLDWRLIVAQMYQESRFDADKKSWAGARGLMQLLPRAAREVGIHDLSTHENSITAGVRYLRRMIDLIDPRLPLETRIRFGLASYNAGRGHVLDARRLARRRGWSPDIWYDNVEKAMLLLSKPRYYNKARFGYVRGIEPVNYVREIEDRYLTYTRDVPIEVDAAGI